MQYIFRFDFKAARIDSFDLISARGFRKVLFLETNEACFIVKFGQFSDHK